ncbi:tyrosine-type recombinase/integrase [Paraburkholderia phymatum]|uniref:tyrosine-type recombinase/integrase n=1 Tax=Paraburkholderia phymatum TaxID=148447 RepID=UPI000694862C
MLAETGARLAEIVGLRRVDCYVEASTPYIHIIAHASRSIKTAHSERKVPLTPRALQGLQRALKLSEGDAYVFPRYTSDEGCKATHASNTLNDWLKSRKIAPTAHGMRHGMRDLLRAAEAPQDIVEQLQGWGKVSQSSKYGAGHSLETLLRWLSKAVV